MITGHFGIAAGTQSLSRERMGSFLFLALLAASVIPDAVDVLYAAVTFCNPHGLYSHTVHAVVLEAAIVGGIAFLVTSSRRLTLLFIVVVLLHPTADYITGRKLLVPGGELVGLRMYDRPLIDWLFEIPLVAIGWWLLRRSGRGPRWASSVWALLALVTIQTTLDTFFVGRGDGLKPNVCPVVSAPLAS